MWYVEFESLKAQQEAEQLIKTRKLNSEDQAIIHSWIQQVSHHGPESIQGDFKWADHALGGEWAGYRSSAYSNKGRIIYRLVAKKILIQITRITHDHNYKKEQKNEKSRKKTD